MWGIHVLLLLAAGLVLADASVVTLALPPVIAELDASVEQAAAVLGVYTLVLAVALPLVVRLPARTLAAGGALRVRRRRRPAAGVADSIEALLVLRGVQALGGAALLVGAFTLLDAGGARPPRVDRGGDLRLRRRPRARRGADAGVRLAGDLPRPGPHRPRRLDCRLCRRQVDKGDNRRPARLLQCPGFARAR